MYLLRSTYIVACSTADTIKGNEQGVRWLQKDQKWRQTLDLVDESQHACEFQP